VPAADLARLVAQAGDVAALRRSAQAEPRASKAEFPKFSLEDALRVPNALQRNGGQPLPAIEMATAVRRSPGSSDFRVLTAASSAYGLSGGSYKTQFSMGVLGQAITQPTTPDEEARSVVAAALRPPVFQAVYDYYKGKRYPEGQFFANTIIREFGVEPKQAEKFVEVFTANMRFAGLIRETPGGNWLAKDAVPQSTSTTVTEQEVEDVDAEAEAERE